MRFGIALLALVTFGCAGGGDHIEAGPAATGERGHLVIVGGALDPGNERIYGRILELVGPGGELGVLPTASGVWRESGPDNVARFDARAGGDVAEVLPIHLESVGSADDARWAERIDGLGGVYFTGGDQARIVAALRPGGSPTAVDGALDRLLQRGGVISGSSAGAAMMSDPMIYGGRSARALRDGARDLSESTDVDGEGPGGGVEFSAGMGYFPYGLVDQHFLERGRLGRLIIAMEATGKGWGWGISEDRGVHVDLSVGVVEVLGDGGLLLVDGREMRRVGEDLVGLRLSLLGDGDRVNVPGGVVEVAEGCRSFAPRPVRAFRGPVRLEGDAFDAHAITRAMRRLAGPGDRGAVLGTEGFELHFERGSDSEFYAAGDGHEAGMRVLGIELSIRAMDHEADGSE